MFDRFPARMKVYLYNFRRKHINEVVGPDAENNRNNMKPLKNWNNNDSKVKHDLIFDSSF